MAARDYPSVDSDDSRTSRRGLLRALATAPIAAAAMSPKSPWGDALTSLHEDYGDEPVTMTRTKEGRTLSRRRYHIAEGFFPDRQQATGLDWHDYLYKAGITAQLALSSHLLDVGFPDGWNARHIGLRVAKSLAYANATGLGHDCPDMGRLAAILSPYWQWNRVRLFGEPKPDDGGFTVERIDPLLRALLDRVHAVTGHPRPNGWQRYRQERWS